MNEPFETDKDATGKHQIIYGRYEKVYTLNDFFAALFFVIGSIMSFHDSLMNSATWCFTPGSVNFMLRSTIA